MKLRRRAVPQPAHSGESLMAQVASTVRDLDQMVRTLERRADYLQVRATGSMLPPEGASDATAG